MVNECEIYMSQESRLHQQEKLSTVEQFNLTEANTKDSLFSSKTNFALKSC